MNTDDPRRVQTTKSGPVVTTIRGQLVNPRDIAPPAPTGPLAWSGPPATGTLALSADDGDRDVEVRIGAFLEVSVRAGNITVDVAPVVLCPREARREGESAWASLEAVAAGRTLISGTLRVAGPKSPGRHWRFGVVVVDNAAPAPPTASI